MIVIEEVNRNSEVELKLPKSSRDVRAAKFTRGADNYERDSFFVSIWLKKKSDWKLRLKIELELAAILKKIAPFSMIYVSYYEPHANS
jgi:hypothetical protein